MSSERNFRHEYKFSIKYKSYELQRRPFANKFKHRHIICHQKEIFATNTNSIPLPFSHHRLAQIYNQSFRLHRKRSLGNMQVGRRSRQGLEEQLELFQLELNFGNPMARSRGKVIESHKGTAPDTPHPLANDCLFDEICW